MPENTTSKYFVPQIEDIRVGYECEFWADPSKEEKGWIPWKFRDVFEDHSLQSIRVPYLTKEQIEAEGWKITDYAGTVYRFEKDDFYFSWFPFVPEVRFDRKGAIGYNLMKPSQTLFLGECKDINTFRWICKLLNIN